MDSKINFSSCLKCHWYYEEIIPLGKYETLEKLWDSTRKTKLILLWLHSSSFLLIIELWTLSSYHFIIVALSQRWLCPSPGHIWQCPETFFVIITGRVEWLYWHLINRDQEYSYLSYHAQDNPNKQELIWLKL